jgi:hypothetical protein
MHLFIRILSLVTRIIVIANAVYKKNEWCGSRPSIRIRNTQFGFRPAANGGSRIKNGDEVEVTQSETASKAKKKIARAIHANQKKKRVERFH